MRLKITFFLFLQAFCFHQIYAQCDGADFEERNGIAILELDSKVSGSWRRESLSRASGGSALTYRGSNYFSSPGNSIITYRVKINSSGTYRFIWRNKISIIARTAPSTEHNDAWLKINASNFYGQRGNSRVYPGGSGKSPVAEGATSGGWFKVYTNTIDWSWSTKTSDNDAHAVYATFNSPGVYNIQVSGRSNGHSIDRMVLYKESSYSSSQAESLSRSVTSCSGSTPTPPPPPPTPTTNQAPTLNISSPTNGQTFLSGGTVTVRLSASDSDGNIQKYEVFVNNEKVDTDGASYTPYVLSNVQPGNYAIRAVVTDNGGKTASKTVNISVNGNTPNPTPNPTNLPPSVSFTNLTNGQSFNPDTNVSINLRAIDSDGSVAKHEIFVNNTLVDTDGASYSPHVINNIATGTYEIKATVTDNDGATNSAIINIVVGAPTPPPSSNIAPTVQFLSLTNGQVIPVGTTALVAITANDSDGSIRKYQVYVNNQLVDTDGANYTSHPFRQTVEGNYAIRVVVTDNDGATGTATVNVVVGTASTPTTPTITLNLIDATEDVNIGTLTNGTLITTSNAQNINIRASVPSQVKSVSFNLSGPKTEVRVENFAPFALFGDLEGDYVSETLTTGSYTLVVSGYSDSDADGVLIATKTINFSVGSSSNTSKTAVAFPNPILSDGKVSVRLPEGSTGEIYYTVSNSLGVNVEQGKFSANPKVKDVDLELQKVGQQAPGIYYLTLISKDNKQTIPLVRK